MTKLKPNPTKEEIAEYQRLKYEKLKLEAELYENLPHLYGYPMYPWMREFFESKNPLLFLTCANQVGKALCVNTEIPTPEGLKRMGDLKVGDYVYSDFGNPTKIKYVPYRGVDETYRITFHDGSTVDASGEHLWFCKGGKSRFTHKDKWKVLSTEEIIKLGNYKPEATPGRRFVIPLTDPIRTEGIELFDPYMLGLLLGDGSIGERSISIHSADPEIVDYVSQNYVVSPNGKYGYRIKVDSGVQGPLREMGLLGTDCFNKFIPEKYFLGSINQRLMLLRGLMDTDGTVADNGITSFCTSSGRLAEDVKRLVSSLGGLAFTKKRESVYKKNGYRCHTGHHYQLRISLRLNPFRLTRKANKHRPQERDQWQRLIYKIEPIGKKEVMCISVGGNGSFLCTKNSIVTHNSSIQIRKMIHWATCPDLWPKLWKRKPITFWYLYPSLIVSSAEVNRKWVPEYLPREKYKNHPVYGWKLVKDNGLITEIIFNSGVTIAFKSYATNEQMLQTGTVHYLAFDEEMPAEGNSNLWPELVMRVAGVESANGGPGYISGVFTPTLSQQFWYDVMEKRGQKGERLPTAHKITASLYDSMYYEDGTPSKWTKERITQIENALPTDDEIKRRVYGRFIMSKKGLTYPSFNKDINVIPEEKIPDDWHWYYGIDSGSGGYEGGHPAAVVGVAVSPKFDKGVVAECWVGKPENIEGDDKNTTAGDILAQYLKMSKGKKNLLGARYDFADKDLEVIASRNGVHLEKADKSHETGEGLINTLFKNQMLSIYDTVPNDHLVLELTTLRKEQNKRKALDHAVDALRYCCTGIAWDLSVISDRFQVKTTKKEVVDPFDRSEGRYRQAYRVEEHDFSEEIDEWNDLYGSEF